MQYNECGGVIKHCLRCGKRMDIENYFEAVPRKYCKQCAEDAAREQRAAYMRKQRAKARELRQLERERTAQTMNENEMLRQIVRQQAARIEQLKEVLNSDGI